MAGVEAATAAAAAQLHHLDLVRFEAAEGDEKRHGDHGLVVYTAPKTTVMCVDGAVVDKTDAAALVIVDRSSLHPGMEVTSASDPAGQIGVVTAVSTAVDLVEHRADGDYGDAEAAPAARGLSPSGLRRVTEFSLGDYVVCSGGGDQWLGRVVEVCVAVDVVFDDGAACRITGDRAQDRVIEVEVAANTYRRRGMNGAFYPGQRVTGHHVLASPSIAFKDARWLRGYWKLTRLEGTVAKVAMTGVLVYWIASAQLGTSKSLINASSPPAFQDPGDLTLFCSDDECPWAFGDRCFIATPPRHRRRRRQPPAGNTAGPAAAAPAPSPTLIVRVSAAVRKVFDVASQLVALGKSYLVTVSSSSSISAAAATATGNAEAPPPAGPTAGGDVNVEPAPAVPAAVALNGVAGEDAAAPAPDAAALPSSSDAGGGDGDGGDSAGDGGGKEKVEDDSLGVAHFDVVQCPPDHHFLDCKLEGAAHGNKWVKRVQKEWQILGNDNLPGTIYVRAFEDRMDLLRAAMVGAAGSPYHDGLFLFDLHLPATYPAAPPEVYYHSFGLRVNPNLYPSGTVCLSLLNTFDGEGVEVWSPARSTLLQVLVSIQGLVLTADPYYNEAGYDAYAGTPGGRRNAASYAENACLLTLRSALHLLRRPPRGFEGVVGAHFRRRGAHVLAACESYLRGTRVAGDGGDGGGGERTCSAGFRLALRNVVPVLAAAFAEIGVEGCERFGDGELGQCSLTAFDDSAASADASD
ncbi:probable ubiquitin-conjugating enzyme E2 23 [Oryza glaberrima]|uniref:probable ubiquitin-conjugating enzyme E2 23 n=1 Tax=Oryza glaberrima TaxID=4538 RepID=UPI00224C35CA|nr:probable ubiquitin-conjugating enzyme E2 23 [Oryza glaberrima]